MWSKKWVSEPKKISYEKPTVLTPKEAEKLEKRLTSERKSGRIESGSDKMTEIFDLGRLNTQHLEAEFGKIKTDEIIVTNERLSHIEIRHPEDYSLFEKFGKVTVQEPDIIIKDLKNDDTVFMIKRMPETNLNVVVKLILDTDKSDYKNSVMTFYRIREKNLIKLEKKNKTLYKKE